MNAPRSRRVRNGCELPCGVAFAVTHKERQTSYEKQASLHNNDEETVFLVPLKTGLRAILFMGGTKPS